MKIVKYKKLTGGKYEVLLDNNEKIKLFEDVILKEGLLLKKEIDDVDRILLINNKYEIENTAMKYLNHHVMSIKGMKNYLLKKYEDDEVKRIIDKLIMQGFLNDKNYAKCYISNQINLSNDGPRKIIKHLEDNNIDSDIYLEYLDISDKVWKERIDKYLEKQAKTNKKSAYFFRSKMIMNLVNLGYDKEMIESCLNNIHLTNTFDLKKKEEDKIRKRLSHKYSGEELERKIKEKLYQKGFFE